MPATILLAISLSNFIWLVVALFILFTALAGVVLSLTWLERKLLGQVKLVLSSNSKTLHRQTANNMMNLLSLTFTNIDLL